MSGWPDAARTIGMEGLHFRHLRHTGNHIAARSGAGLRDLMLRMSDDSERAAMIYQHEGRRADRTITDAFDVHVQAEHGNSGDDDGPAGVFVPAG